MSVPFRSRKNAAPPGRWPETFIFRIKHMKISTQTRAGAMSLIALSVSLPVRAQSIDYEAMEQLFGEPVTASVTG